MATDVLTKFKFLTKKHQPPQEVAELKRFDTEGLFYFLGETNVNGGSLKNIPQGNHGHQNIFNDAKIKSWQPLNMSGQKRDLALLLICLQGIGPLNTSNNTWE